jgi:hypothetical protein
VSAVVYRVDGRSEDEHDGSLVDGSDVRTSILGCVLESVPGDSLRCLVRNELDTLYDTIDNLSHNPISFESKKLTMR